MKFVLLSLMFLAGAGCVSSSKHQKMVNDLESQLSEERANSATKSRNIEELQLQVMGQSKDKGKLQSSLDEMKKAMAEMNERQAEQKKRLQEFADLTRRFKKLTDAGTLSVKIVDGKMVVSLGSDVLFPAGSAKLSKEGMQAIKEVTQQLNSIPGKRYQVEGHTDNVPISTATFPSNWELASARAISVVQTMMENGMQSSRVSAASYADTNPVASNSSQEGKAANRRVAIVIVPDLSTMPGYEELQKLSN